MVQSKLTCTKRGRGEGSKEGSEGNQRAGPDCDLELVCHLAASMTTFREVSMSILSILRST